MNNTAKNMNSKKNDGLKNIKNYIDALLVDTYKCDKFSSSGLKAGDIHNWFTLHGVRVDVEIMGTQIVVALPLITEKIACEGISCRDITTNEKTGEKSNRYGEQKCEFYIVPNGSSKLQNGTQKVSKESYISSGDDWRIKVKEIFDQVFPSANLQQEHPLGDGLVVGGGKTGSSTSNATQFEKKKS